MTNSEPIFCVSNKHGVNSGEPPNIDGSEPGKYYSYFENKYGEQSIFVYDHQTQTGTLYMGDIGWDEPVTITEDTRSDLLLNDAGEKLGYEVGMTGVATGQHPLELYRARLGERGILSCGELLACEDGRTVRVAGLLVMHQAPPTAKGFRFLTLEDEDALVNVIVQPKVYERYRAVLRGAALLVVEGRVQREQGVVNLVAARVATIRD